MNGSRMRELRKDAGLYETEIASAMFVSRTTIYRWETGRVRIHPIVEAAFVGLVENVERVAYIKSFRANKRKGGKIHAKSGD